MMWLFWVVGIVMFLLGANAMKTREKFLDSMDTKATKDTKDSKVLKEKSKILEKRVLLVPDSTKNINLVTFELADNGERIELEVEVEIYDLLAEGDIGTIYYQPNKFIKFEK